MKGKPKKPKVEWPEELKPAPKGFSKAGEIREAYRAMASDDEPVQQCASCGFLASKLALERHHPAGRHGMNLLRYVYTCMNCHREAHHDPETATERGLLWPARNTREITDGEWDALLLKINQNKHKQ